MLITILLITSAIASAKTHEKLNAALWLQTSPEYKMCASQAFRWAEKLLDEALVTPYWTAALEQEGDYKNLPPAIIVDVDETVLDNSPFEARAAQKVMDFDGDAWTLWVKSRECEALEGAKEFITHARKSKVKVFYVTNRSLKLPTFKNIRTHLDEEVLLSEVLAKDKDRGWGSNKLTRRAFVAKKYRVLLLIGDDYNDFAWLGTTKKTKTGTEDIKPTVKERMENALLYKKYWGRRWLIIPNPLYGSFEKASRAYDKGLEDLKDEIKVKKKKNENTDKLTRKLRLARLKRKYKRLKPAKLDAKESK